MNYIKRMKSLFIGCTLTVCFGGGTRPKTEMKRFWKLYELTLKSIEKDIELAQEDSAFAVIAAPWFPVKCYYALYYLESILMYLIDGDPMGFRNGGHTGIRRKFCTLVNTGAITFSDTGLNHIYSLTQIRGLPAIASGQNTTRNYWQKAECTDSIAKKLMEYKLHDAGKKWNLHTKKGQEEKKQFIAAGSLMLTDLFYWYRIKANYRDLDYIDFENGISENEVLAYITIYRDAFECYRLLLVGEIGPVLTT
ncbi:MAG: hypothetical protein WC787_04750 [Patescibacteria group bacterium]